MSDYLQILDGLRATRDADSCLRGLNLFRRALRGEDGPTFLARYLRQSPDWQELQAVWDTQLTVQHYHVTVTLLLTLADAVRKASAPQPAAAGATAEEQAQQAAVLAGGAASLTSAVLHRRLKALYFCLSSDVHGKANAALTLLEAVAATCGAPLATSSSTMGRSASGGTVGSSPVSLRDFVRSFDWSLSALPGLAKPPREKKGEAAADHRKRYWQQWALRDPLKRPCRAAFCQLALTLLRQAGASGDALLVQHLLHLRPLMGGLLTHLAADPPHQQLVVLQTLQKRVLAAKAAVPAAAQAEVFSDATLQQLAAIATHAPALGEEEEAEEEEAEAEAAGRRQAAAAAQAVLLAVATDPSHGLTLAAAAAAGPSFVLADAGSQQLQPGQRRLLRMLLRLRPADSAAHLQLLLAAVAGDAPLAAALLLALPYTLEPAAAGTAAGSAAAGRWFAHTAVASRLLQLLPETAAPGLALRAASGGAAPPPGGRQAQALLRCCFPACLQKAALSRGLQHSNALVRHGTLALLISSMSVLEAVLGDCTAAAATSAGCEHPPLAPQQQGWLALRGWLQQAARQHLPDPTLLLALLAGSEKEGWENANELQLTAVLRLLLLWQRLLPAALVEASVDAERLMPSQPLGLRPQHQLLLLELLAAAAEASAAAAAATDGGAAAAAVAATSAAPVLLAALRLLAAPGVAAPVRVAARDWLARRLLATGAFSGNEEEAVLWLDLLPRGGKGSEALASFLSEAVQLLLRRPHELYEQQQQLLATAAGGEAGDGIAEGLQEQEQEQAQPQFSLLAPCALRQLLRMLPSSKIPSADKAAVVAYVATVLGQLAQQQLGAAACAQLAAVLVGIVRLEALRQQGLEQPPTDAAAGKQKKQKKRKLADGDSAVNSDTAVASLVLPAEGRPLLALLAALEQQGGGAEAASEDARKGQKRGSSATEDGQLRPAAVVQPDSAVDEEIAKLQDGTGGACCQLISQLTAAGNSSSDTASLLAAVQQHLAGSDGGSCGAAVRQCLHLLDSRNAPAAAEAALLQVLQAAALLGGDSGSMSQLRCLQLLAGSTCVARSLAPGGNTALAAAVTQLLHGSLTAPSFSANASAAAACCAPLLQRVAAEVEPVLAAALNAKADSDSMPAAAQRFLLLLPCMPAAAVEEVAGVLVGGLAPPPPPLENGSRRKRKKRAEAASDLDAGQHSWLAALAAAVLQQQLTGGSWGGQPGQLGQACRLLLLLASTSTAAEAAADTDGAKGGSILADATECFLQVLSSSHQGAALAALGTAGQLQLLRCCLSQAAAGSGAALQPCAQLAALLVHGSSDCRRLAAVELLPALLGGESASALALALPAAASCVQQQQQKEGEQLEEGLDGDIERELAATLHQQLMPYFSGRQISLGLPGKQQDGSKKRKEKKRKSSSGNMMAPAAHPAAALLAAAAQQLLRQHSLPCLRLVHPCSANEGYQPVPLELLPAQGWLTSSAAQPADNLVQASAAESAEAVVLLLTAGGSSPAVEDLAACVHCVAVTLTGLLRLPPGQSSEESRLLDLLDGPLGDAVAALPASQRSSAAFAELAEVVAGTLGTAVLRHRLAPAAADGAAAEAGSAAAAVAVVRVLRRLLAALLPDDEEEVEVAAGGGDSVGNSSSDEDMPQQQQQQQVTSRAEVAAAALQLLQRLLGHSRFLPAMRAAAAACPPPLPPAAAALPRPLVSLLPLAAAADEPSVVAADQNFSSAEVAADLKKELCEVLETLLDLHQQYSSSTSSTSSARKAAAEQQLLVQAAEAALLPLLMAGYGASCSPADAATWSLAAAIDRRQWLRQQRAQQQLQQQQQQPAAGQDTEEEESATAAALLVAEGGDAEGVSLTALLHGPLSQTCFAWGSAAAALQQAASGGAAASADQQQQQQQQQQRALLQQRLPLEPARAALTVCHWPEACTLSAPGSGAASCPASKPAGSGSGGGLAQLPAVAAAYDPGFLLPFCCACLQRQLLSPRAFAEAGLLSVCLRGLAAADSGCRAAAYQALALFEAQLGAAAAPDFRERQQLSVLLGALRAAVVRPFQRLPAVHAVFLAEAALLALHPGASMYPAANKHLTRRAVLSTTDVPLLGQLLLGGGQQHVEERRWMMQLLLAGLRTAPDAELYRRQHVLELAMSLSDSCVADPEAAAMALRLLCAATYIPRASRQLVQESGLIPWLAQAAQGAAAQRSHDGGAAGGEQALAALRRLLHLRAVMRGSGGGAAVRQMTAAGCQLANVALAGAGSCGGNTRRASAAGPAGSPRSLLLLEFLQGVQELEGTSHAAGQGRWHHLDGGNSAALSAAVDALHRTLRPSQPSE